MNLLLSYLVNSTMAQKRRLAALAGSSLPSIRLAAKGYRSRGAVNLSAEFAARIEMATVIIADRDPSAAAPVGRESLCTTCAECPYQKACNL